MTTVEPAANLSKGLWFHGTPVPGLRRFMSADEMQGGGTQHLNNGIYFARTPLASCPYAWSSYGVGGWIYAVRLAVEKPFYGGGIWGKGSFLTRADTDDLKQRGHDCFVMSGKWTEIVLFGPIPTDKVEIVAKIRGGRQRKALRLAFQPGQDAAIEAAWQGRIRPEPTVGPMGASIPVWNASRGVGR